MKEQAKNKHRRCRIGILVDPAFKYRSEQIIAGVESVARNFDLNLLCFKTESISSTEDTSDSIMLPFDIINKKNVDGLIVMSEVISRYVGSKWISNLVKKYYPLPLVSIGLKIRNVPSIVTLKEKGLKTLISHLVKQHHKQNIALITGPVDNPLTQSMLKTYIKSMKDFKLPFNPHLIVRADFDYYSGKNAVHTLLDELKLDFDTVITLNNEVALGVIIALQERGLRVPNQITVVGFEDQKTTDDELLPLTVLKIPFFKLGQTAAELLYRQISGEKVPHTTSIPTELVIRESCGCIPVLHDIQTGRKAGTDTITPFSLYHKKNIASKISKPHPRLSKQRSKLVKELIQELIDALTDDITNKTTHCFIVKWKEFLYQHIATGINTMSVLNILSSLREYIYGGIKETSSLQVLEDIIYKAVMIAGRFLKKADSVKNVKELEQGKIIEKIEEELLMALDVDKLAAIILQRFSSIDIKSCYISLYEEIQDPLRYSRLLVAFSKKHLKPIHQKDVRFLTNRLVPLSLLPVNRRYAFFIETLSHENEPLGLLVLELKKTDLKVCEFLKKRLSTALTGVKRLQEVKVQAQNLENLVSSRTHDLTQTNVQLQEEILVRLRAEEELRKSEERYRKWFEDDFTGDFIANAKGDIIACNPAFAHIFGFSTVREAMRANFGDFYPNKSALEDFFTLLNVVKRIEYYEAEFLRPNGSSIHVIGNIIGSFDKQGNLIEMRGYLFDNTERKNLEAELRQSHKMEAIGRLAGGIAHDFNNLLTGIMGYSEIMLQSLDGKSTLRKEVEEIKKAAKSAASLTRQLLAFSRKQVLQPTLLNLNDVVVSMNEMLKRLIGEHIKLVTKLNMDIANVRADRGQIEQVIMNLVLNSRDALPHGGEILIETQNQNVTGATTIHSPEIQVGKYIVISVSDNGIGMDPEVQSHIFEPFFTTKKEGKGVGLGLSTVYGIITQSGGYTQVISEPGKGTTVRIYLAEYEEEAGLVGKEIKHPESMKVKKTILLVEDEQIVRELAKKILLQAGYHVLSARNGREALMACKKIKDPIDLLLSDVIMPGMNGLELAKKIAGIQPKLKVLYMSGYSDKSIIHEAVSKKGSNFIQKPFSPETLLKKVREIFVK
ncbi:MAG: substrate-binding domain-containing protein [Spirochaetales bacterium]|nr:substrate-binding domain-containing protein [Spirochaetales bacterium]